jgi:hypothetical protein
MREMAYSGLFLRHYMGDKPGLPASGQNMSNSPDIIIEGTKPVEPSTLETPESYATEPPDTLIVGSERTNYVYVRGLNATTGPLKGRFWLWYAEPNMLLWPQDWLDGFHVKGAPQNYVEVDATGPNQIVVKEAFELVAPKLPQDHYCMVAIAENPPLLEPAAPPFPGYFLSAGEFAAWIQANPNAAWRNTIDQPQDAASWSYTSPVKGPKEGGELGVGVKCKGMPVGSQYEFNLPGGTTKAGEPYAGVNSGKRTVVHSGEIEAETVTWPGEVVAGLAITWWANGQPPPPTGATIIPLIGVEDSQLEGLVEDPRKGAVKIRLFEDFGDPKSARAAYMHIIGATPLRSAPSGEGRRV